jgi:hypothetical protein
MTDDEFEDSKFDLDITVETEEEDFSIVNDDMGDEKAVEQLMGRGKNSPVFCQFCLVVLDTMNLYVHHAANNHQSQIEKLWLQCQECSFFFPDDETIARHKYKYHEVSLIIFIAISRNVCLSSNISKSKMRFNFILLHF